MLGEVYAQDVMFSVWGWDLEGRLFEVCFKRVLLRKS